MFYNFITKYTENFCWKNWEKLLHCKSFSHFFNKKYWPIWDIHVWNFNKTLTNHFVSFEELGPVMYWYKNNKDKRTVIAIFFPLRKIDKTSFAHRSKWIIDCICIKSIYQNFESFSLWAVQVGHNFHKFYQSKKDHLQLWVKTSKIIFFPDDFPVS